MNQLIAEVKPYLTELANGIKSDKPAEWLVSRSMELFQSRESTMPAGALVLGMQQKATAFAPETSQEAKVRLLLSIYMCV